MNGRLSYGKNVPSVLKLPVLRSVKMAGNFDALLSFGVGLAQKHRFVFFNLTEPARLVIDFNAFL